MREMQLGMCMINSLILILVASTLLLFILTLSMCRPNRAVYGHLQLLYGNVQAAQRSSLTVEELQMSKTLHAQSLLEKSGSLLSPAAV